MTRDHAGVGFIAATFMAAFALTLLPLPDYLGPIRPNWLALVLCYWVLETPHRVGLGVAFLVGLAADLVFGTLIGEQALRMSVIAFIVLRFRPRLKFFTLPQQALAILALLLNDRIVMLMIRALSGEGVPPVAFWIAPAIGTLVWPWLYLLLDDLRMRLRTRGPRL